MNRVERCLRLALGPAASALLATTALLAATALLATAALQLAIPSAAGAISPPRLAVRSAILIEPSTGQRLYGARPAQELAIASTTKLMTALITLEHVHHLGVVFTQNNYYAASVDSQIGLVPGERMSVHDLLVALMLPSADDAAEDLAYNVGHRSVARFVAMMNARARQLGLAHTHYSTPSGLDTPGNHSSAEDLVRLAAYDLSHFPVLARIVALRSAVLHTGSHVRYVVNRNTLLRYHWINGVKTGHTAAAGYVLVASGHRYGMTLLSAVLGTSSPAARDANTLALLDYGFAGFRLATPVHAGQVLARPRIRYRSGRAALLAAHGLTRVIGRRAGIRIVVRAPRELTGPIRRHTVEGTATVLVGGRPVARIALLLAQAVPAVSPLTLAARFITQPLSLVVIVAALGALGALALSARQRRRTRAAAARGLEHA